MLRWNPTRTAWKAPALALALLAGPAAVPALAGPAPGQVAPLLAMGAPITMLLMTTSPPVRKRIVRVVHSLPVRVIGYPLIAWVLFTMTLYVLYFSPLFELSLRNQYVHDAIHLHFIAVGLLFWWPVVGVDPTRWRLHHLARVLYVFLMVPFHAFLG